MSLTESSALVYTRAVAGGTVGVAYGVGSTAMVLGSIFLFLSHRLPAAFLSAVPTFGAGLIIFPMLANGPGVGTEVLILLPVIYAAYFLPRRLSLLSLVVILGMYLPIAAAKLGADALVPGVSLTASSIATLLIVTSLRTQVDRLLVASRAEARTDELTGLRNRRGFDELAGPLLAQCARHDEPASLMMLDIDHFKTVNDTAGHQAGDKALQRLARLLAADTRRSDVLARMGGEEFVLLLPHASTEHAVQRAEQIRAMVEEVSQTWPQPLTLSIGVAAMPDHADQQSTLLAAADLALYEAKRQGRNRVRTAQPGRPLEPPGATTDRPLDYGGAVR